MSAPTIAATWAPTAESRLLADTLADARDQLAAARGADIHDHTAMVASHAAVTATLARVLWALNAEAGS